MLKIHRPVAFWMGTVILGISVSVYQFVIHEYNVLHTLFDGPDREWAVTQLGMLDGDANVWFDMVTAKSTPLVFPQGA